MENIKSQRFEWKTFEIRRGQSDDGACAENQVKKYHLTYEQLKERL